MAPSALVIALLFDRDERLTFETREVSIGSAADNTIVRAGLLPHHCAIVVRAAGCFVVDRSRGKTLVNGHPISAPRALYSEDVVELGGSHFLIDHLDLVRDPIEDEFLAAFADPSSRAVYADWLEENGDDRRAELLRAQELLAELGPDDLRVPLLVQRLRALSIVVDREWRIHVARARLARCGANEGLCDQDWSELALGERNDTRACRTCHARVRFCESPAEVQQWLADGQRAVVVDPTVPAIDLAALAARGYRRVRPA